MAILPDGALRTWCVCAMALAVERTPHACTTVSLWTTRAKVNPLEKCTYCSIHKVTASLHKHTHTNELSRAYEKLLNPYESLRRFNSADSAFFLRVLFQSLLLQHFESMFIWLFGFSLNHKLTHTLHRSSSFQCTTHTWVSVWRVEMSISCTDRKYSLACTTRCSHVSTDRIQTMRSPFESTKILFENEPYQVDVVSFMRTTKFFLFFCFVFLLHFTSFDSAVDILFALLLTNIAYCVLFDPTMLWIVV